MRVRAAATFVIACLLSACAQQLVDDKFAGPTATVRDSQQNIVPATMLVAGHADFFVMWRADGKFLPNAIGSTQAYNSGSGFRLTIHNEERRVPIHPMQVELHAETYFSAPISGLFNNSHEVTGTVAFTPVAGETYTVTGELRDGYAGVWIVNAAGQSVTAKVERRK